MTRDEIKRLRAALEDTSLAYDTGFQDGLGFHAEEIARLRKIEAAARPLVVVDPDDDVIPDEEWDPMFLALRAALEGSES